MGEIKQRRKSGPLSHWISPGGPEFNNFYEYIDTDFNN